MLPCSISIISGCGFLLLTLSSVTALGIVVRRTPSRSSKLSLSSASCGHRLLRRTVVIGGGGSAIGDGGILRHSGRWTSTRGCNDARNHQGGAGLRCSSPTSTTALATASNNNGHDFDANQPLPPQPSIEAWLADYLPTLAPADLRSYAATLGNDGVTSVDKLYETIVTAGDEEEDYLTFMKKGHRRVLMKNIDEVLGSLGKDDSEEEEEDPPSPSSSEGEMPLQREQEGGEDLSSTRQLTDVEELERYIQKKRADRIAEEEELERLLLDAKKLKASSGSSDERMSSGEAQALVENLGVVTRRSEAEEKEDMAPLPGVAGGDPTGAEGGEECLLGEEEFWQDECWDITREPVFTARTTPSLSTGRRGRKDGLSHSRGQGGSGAGGDRGAAEECVLGEEDSWDEECWDYYDITRSSFPEDAPAGQEPFRAFAASPRAFRGGEMSEMNDRPPPAAAARPGAAAASALFKRIKAGRRRDATREGREEYADITQKFFPDLRSSLRSSFNDAEKSEMNSRAPPRRVHHPLSSTPRSGSSTTTKKTLTNATPSIKADEEDTSHLDITSLFPEDRRPASLVNTIGNKRELGLVRKESEARRLDESFQEGLAGERPALSEDTGTKKRDTTYGVGYEEESRHTVTRNIAQNFSRDRKSLVGNPAIKTIDHTKPKSTAYLNINEFPSDLAPPSRAVDSSSTKHEKYLDAPPRAAFETIPARKLVPNPFARNKPASLTATNTGAKKPPQKQKPLVTEADKYLDTNQFSWNLFPNAASAAASSASTKTLTPSQQQQRQPFLDTPGHFRSTVNMRSSNYSGAKFKRSSDIPPEQKMQNRKDCYDISSGATATAAPKNKRRERTGAGKVETNREVEEEGEYFDITRVPLSMGARTSAVIKDANSASSRAVGSDTGEAHSKPPDSSSDNDDEESSLSFKEVMHWLLTHLPQLQEEDAIAYFNHLLEDGFDSIAMLQDVLEEEDLYFMKRGHVKLLKNVLGGGNEGDDEEMAVATVDDGEKVDGEKVEAPIREKEAEEVLLDSEKDDDEPGDITRSAFVDGPSVWGALPAPNRNAKKQHEQVLRSGEPNINDEMEEVSESPDDRASSSLAAENPTRDNEQTKVMHEDDEPAEEKEGRARGPNAPKIVTAAPGGVAPRAELYQYYSQEKSLTSAQCQQLKDYFTTWTNGAKSHELEFTCVFSCPLTGEHFACGNWNSDRGQAVPSVEDPFLWYKNKKQAMNAAAAKALDCFSLRACHGTERTPLCRCRDAPYLLEGNTPFLLPTGIQLPTTLIPPGDRKGNSQ